MKVTKDIGLDLAKLPELLVQRNELLSKIENDTATVREARKFVQLHSLIMMFQNAKLACKQIRKNGSNIGNQVMQEMIVSERKSRHPQPMVNPVLR